MQNHSITVHYDLIYIKIRFVNLYFKKTFGSNQACFVFLKNECATHCG